MTSEPVSDLLEIEEGADWEAEYQEWCWREEAETRKEFLAHDAADPIRDIVSGVRFISRSKGRGRRRRIPTIVTLLSHSTRGWHAWSGEDRHDNGKHPWDTIAIDTLGREACDRLIASGVHPDDYVRNRVEKLFTLCNGRF